MTNPFTSADCTEPAPELSVAVLLLPGFRLLPVGGFVGALRHTARAFDRRWRRVSGTMQSQLARPPSSSRAGSSSRQLERLVQRNSDQSARSCCMRFRLQQAPRAVELDRAKCDKTAGALRRWARAVAT